MLEEKIARESIKCCLKLSKIWDSSSDVIAFLWDFFHKRLVSDFISDPTKSLFAIIRLRV